MFCNNVDAIRTPGTTIRFRSLDFIVGSKETMGCALEALVLRTSKSLDVIEGFSHLRLSPS
jgi:phosphopantetheine adenylyltransferase